MAQSYLPVRLFDERSKDFKFEGIQLISDTLIEKREWIQNSDFQNSDITKQRLLQNSDNYKTATVTKQRLLQNGEK